MSKRKVLWELFISTLYLSTFTFGGGFVIVTLMKKKMVDQYHWIDEKEMLDMTALAQSSPGSVSINSAILVGYKIGKLPGALVSILGTVIPPLTIISVISMFYTMFKDNVVVKVVLNGMRVAVAAIILDVVWSMAKGLILKKKVFYIAIMVCAFIATYFFKLNAVLVLGCCILAGIGKTIWKLRRV